MNIKRIIVLFLLLMLSVFVILSCGGSGGSYTVVTTKTTLYDFIGGSIVAGDNGTRTILNADGEILAYIDEEGNITDTEGNTLGTYDSSTGEIKDTDGEVVCYIDNYGNVSEESAYVYLYSEKAHPIDIIITTSNNIVSSVESFSGIEDGDEINIFSGIVSLEDYYNGVSLDSELNYNFLRPVGGSSYDIIGSQISVKTDGTTRYNQALGIKDRNNSYRSFFTEDKLDKYTYFVGNLDTNHELQKVTAYVDTTNDMFSSIEMRVENDEGGYERLHVTKSAYAGNTSGYGNFINANDWNQPTRITYDTASGFSSYHDYQFLLDDYNQTLIYNIDSEAGNETYGYIFCAFTDRYRNNSIASGSSANRLYNLALEYNSYMITEDVVAQKYSNFSIGLVSMNNTTLGTANKPIIYLVENDRSGDYNSSDYSDDYAVITLGNADVGLAVTSNNDISIDTDPYSGIGYFRKSGSYFMEMEVTEKDNSTLTDDEGNTIENDNGTITLSSITRDMVDNNSIVVGNETVIVNVINGKITQGNYLLFAGQHLFNDTSNINVGDKFVIRFDKGAVVFRKDIANLYGYEDNISFQASGVDGIYNTLYATYDGKQSPAIHQITSSSYDNFTTTFSSVSGDTATFYIPQIDDNDNITYREVKVQLKEGLNTSDTVSDTISFNYGTVTKDTTLAELNLLEDYWASNSGNISITIDDTIDKNTMSFSSNDTVSHMVTSINDQLELYSDGTFTYDEDTGIFTLIMLKKSSVSISGDLADLLGITYSSSDESE